MFTDGSRIEDGAAGYAVVWKRGVSWAGIKTHMGYNQEAYDTECAAHARALELAARRNSVPERVTIFSYVQAAIRRMALDEPGTAAQYALQARKHVATLRRARSSIVVRIRWCPAHRGVAGNEKADEWAKIAAEESDTHGVEWLNYSDRTGERAAPEPRSRANLKREISEKKWGRRASGLRAGPPRQEPPARWRGSWEHQEACLTVLPAQDGALPDRAVPQLDEEPTHPAMDTHTLRTKLNAKNRQAFRSTHRNFAQIRPHGHHDVWRSD